MPFDPTKPANNSPLSSAEVRAQLTGLKSLIDACPTTAAMQNYVLSNSSGAMDSVSALALVPNNPPTVADMQTVISKINELISALNREWPS